MQHPVRHLVAGHWEEPSVTQSIRKKLEFLVGLSCPINKQH